MESLIVHPENEEQLFALKAAYKIKFEEKSDEYLLYAQEFIAKIDRSDKEFASGNFKVVKTEDLWK